MSQIKFAREPGSFDGSALLQRADDDTNSAPKPGTDPRAVMLPKPQERETIAVHDVPVERTRPDADPPHRRTP